MNMKLIRYSLLFFLMQTYHAIRNSSEDKFIRIPLKRYDPETRKDNSRVPRASIPVDDSHNVLLGEIHIGSKPQQKFNVMFDTGSTDLWVFSSKYDTCDPNDEYVRKQHKLYDHTVSSTFMPHKSGRPYLIQYHFGWVFGFQAADMILLGGSRHNREFVEVTKAHHHRAREPYDGVLGLRYSTHHGNIITRYCEKAGGTNKFSFYLRMKFSDIRNKTMGISGGELTLCGVDKSKFVAGTMKYIDEVKPGYWQIPIESVKLNRPEGAVELTIPGKATVDTSTYTISGPEANITKFFELINAQPVGKSGHKQVDCTAVSSLPSVTFRMDNKDFTLTGADYTRETTADIGKHCRLLFHNGTSNHWILGDAFIRKFYTVFDMANQRIGFGQIKN